MRRLLWLNLVLMAVIAAEAWTLRQRYLAGRQREARLLGQTTAGLPAPAVPPAAVVSPAAPSSYLEVAQKMLFARDRNPIVIYEPPPPPPAPPPPKPMPPLPTAFGVMDVGAGPTAILSERPGAPHRAYRSGEKIGDFKVLAMNSKEIILEWEGQRIRKSFDELVDKSAPPPAASEAAQAAAAPSATAVVAPAKAAPGVDLGNQSKACLPGDTSPPGTVADGMRKVVTESPFGKICRWEAVK